MKEGGRLCNTDGIPLLGWSSMLVCPSLNSLSICALCSFHW
ncbi:hypothetical protein AB205_0052220 [Aquarana catesbeiana]|uniref:Uncharacterized protein n=1 Tax=Aquarana catesbeiana TaxID=8400 RepID=A0A2G9Q371_AQUCT|nr:hypothetical protein AB205_0052220 [Aquarana catesbeiana]